MIFFTFLWSNREFQLFTEFLIFSLTIFIGAIFKIFDKAFFILSLHQNITQI